MLGKKEVTEVSAECKKDRAAANPIRVMLVDDHRVMRAGLRALLEGRPGLAVVGEAGDRGEALAVAAREQPDVILLDLNLPGTSGLDLLPELLGAAREARIIILTGVPDTAAHMRAVREGARGLVLKEHAPEVLLKAVEKVHKGEVWYDRSLLANVLGERSRAGEVRGRDPESAKIASLTGREREVIALVGEGLKNRQIADRLFISEGTVRNHVSAILSKLELEDRVELMIFAYQHGLAKPPL